MTKPSVLPAPGYIFTKPFIDKKDTAFKDPKASLGEDQFSEVVAVGADIADSQGIIRTSPAKVGQIIVHAASNKTFVKHFDEYRFVHFTEVHGIYESN